MTSRVRRIEDLEVFRLAHSLACRVYGLSRNFPSEERFGLTMQLRRSAASVCANLAEGAGRLSRPDYRRFVGIAKGSAAEVAYHLLLAKDLGYIASSEAATLRQGYDRVERMLSGLAQALR